MSLVGQSILVLSFMLLKEVKNLLHIFLCIINFKLLRTLKESFDSDKICDFDIISFTRWLSDLALLIMQSIGIKMHPCLSPDVMSTMQMFIFHDLRCI